MNSDRMNDDHYDDRTRSSVGNASGWMMDPGRWSDPTGHAFLCPRHDDRDAGRACTCGGGEWVVARKSRPRPWTPIELRERVMDLDPLPDRHPAAIAAVDQALAAVEGPFLVDDLLEHVGLTWQEAQAEVDRREASGELVRVWDKGALKWVQTATLARLVAYASRNGEGVPAMTLEASTNGRPAAASAPEPVDDTWSPRDLGDVVDGLVGGTLQRPRPSILFGGDDVGFLFYAGHVNALWGESESWKSWIALVTACEVLADGGAVTYVDFEDDEVGMVGRLLALGASPEAIKSRFHYVRPEASPTGDQTGRLLDLAGRCKLVVVDSVGEWLALLDLNGNDDVHYAGWAHQCVRPIAGTGTTVVLIDHLPHDSRGLLRPIGTQRKKASISGAAYRVEVIERPARGVPGRLRLTVAKDRHGSRPSGEVAADVVVAPGEGEAVSVRLEAPRAVVPPEDDDLLVALARAGDDGLTKKEAAVEMLRGQYRRKGRVKSTWVKGGGVQSIEDITERAVTAAAAKVVERRFGTFVEARLARPVPGNPTRWFITQAGTDQFASEAPE